MSEEDRAAAVSAAASQLGRLGGRARWDRITSPAQRLAAMRPAIEGTRRAFEGRVDPNGVMSLAERQAAARAMRSESARRAASARWAKHRQSQAQSGAQ